MGNGSGKKDTKIQPPASAAIRPTKPAGRTKRCLDYSGLGDLGGLDADSPALALQGLLAARTANGDAGSA